MPSLSVSERKTSDLPMLDPGRILVVDDDPLVRNSVRRILERDGLHVDEAGSVAEASRALAERHPDVMLLDIGLPDANGLDFLKMLAPDEDDVEVLMLTGNSDRENKRRSFRHGATGYIEKPMDAPMLEAHVDGALLRRRKRRASRQQDKGLEASLCEARALLELLPWQMAEHLCSAWDLRHVETGTHVRRIASYTEVVAQKLGYTKLAAQELGRVAMLHDIGKIAIPDAILGKNGPLTDDEFRIMKRHPVEGAKMLSGVDHPFLVRAATVALCHHERWDGSGYPNGLRADDCPREARIVAVVDVYDALGQVRCYKKAWSAEQIVTYFREKSGLLFEAPIVDALFESIPRLEAIAAILPEPVPSSQPEK